MAEKYNLPEGLNAIFLKFKKLLAMMPESSSEIEQEQLIIKSVKAEASCQSLSEADRQLLITILLQEVRFGEIIKTAASEGHRPLSIPNEKYPSVSVESERHVMHAKQMILQDVDKLLLEYNVSTLPEDELSVYLMNKIVYLVDKNKVKLNKRELILVHALFMDDILGLGPLESLMSDPAVSDILINGYDRVYIERNGLLKKCLVSFRDNEHLLNVIRKIVSKVGRKIDYSSPYVDARLEDGSRVNAIISPLALDAPCLSIRRFGKRRITLDYMVKIGSISLEMASFLSLAVRSKLNIIVSGGTGSGKTTLLNALSWAIDENERIVTIEDSAELCIEKPHVVRLETAKSSSSKKINIDEQKLVRNALRMRPDRIILGEVRGAEAFDMIQAMNTGHSGSMCTVHANNVDEVGPRICNMVSMGDADHPEHVTLGQLSRVINIIVQVSRLKDGHRRIVDISGVIGTVDGSRLMMQKLFEFQYDKSTVSSKVTGKFARVSDELPHSCIEEIIKSGFYYEVQSIFNTEEA